MLVTALLVNGCSDASSGGHEASIRNSPALYGEPASEPATLIPRARPFDAAARSWQDAAFSFVQTELSPATLYHSSGNYLGVFTGMTNSGLGAPSHLAFSTPRGPRSYAANEKLDPRGMEENWIVVWFAGAEGWTNWDSPWAVFLQHKPASMELNADGLQLRFSQSAGDVVLMPLYGYDKLPLKENNFATQHGLPAQNVQTWKWAEALRTEPLMRVRYWASALREFPLYCEDSFSVDRSTDSVTIRQQFHWHRIDDDWHTPSMKVAPISPPLAQVSRDQEFPAHFSQPVSDYKYFTPYGPYMGVEKADSYEVTFNVLQYLNETEAADPLNTAAHPSVAAALARLQKTARDKFRDPNHYAYDHGGLGNFCWAIQGDGWYAKALPYYDDVTRSNALASLRKYFHEDVLVTNRFKLREYPSGSGQYYYLLEGPGIGSWGVLGDAGKFSADMLETLWAYAQFTGDWKLIQDRWDLVKQLFTTPAETRWVGFGRDAIAELGDEAAPCLAMARMAYRVGDLDTYNYAACQFARELVHHWLKQRGAGYFRSHQPYHSLEAMADEVYLTNLWGDTAGWQIDGPNYPVHSRERQYRNRWVRFKNEDVGRFYREYLSADVREELDRLQSRWEPKRRYVNDSHIMPSLVQLRSLLLNEPPAELAAMATPDQFAGPPSGVIASCWSVIRTSHPTHYVRLIPPGPPSPFVAGLEREVPGPNICLVQSVRYSAKSKEPGAGAFVWPWITWWGWKTPTGQPWNFGHVTPELKGSPLQARVVNLNWNSQAVVYEVARE